MQQLTQGGADATTNRPDGEPHASFTLQRGEEANLYVRLTRQNMFIFSASHELAFTPLIIDLEEEIPQSIVLGLLVGALFGLAIYNLVIAISTRDRSYWWYCAYLLMMAVLICEFQRSAAQFATDLS